MNWKLIILSLGMALTFWDIFNVPYIINYASSQFHVNILVSSLPLSAEMVGYAVGGAVNGLLSSIKGRKPGLMLSMGLVSAGSLLGLLSPSFFWLIPAEFIIGLGIEGELSVVPAYISETVSPENRGKSVGMVTASGFLTTLIVGPVAVLLGGDWRLLFLAGLLVSLVALVSRVRLPESKLWSQKKEGLKWDWWIALMTAVWFLSYFTGYALFSDPMFQFITFHGFQNSSLYFTYVLYGDPLGVLVASFLNDKIERKYSSAAVNIFAGLILVIWPLFSGIPFLALGFAEMFLQGFKFPVMYSYTSEVFRTRIRTLGYGIADGIGHLGGAVGPIIFSYIYSGDQYLAMLAIGVVASLAGVLILRWGVKTTGIPLEQIRR
ncbi:MFS transporter [Metallosphaera tengchongensis]|uniref:MFS transporter n=1 Tax=Metallosphaera tengchongensis TaxID=1532350 RepID=A0A6N0NU61_9CREN|nr:MFS transporter [Metallosphaera tengchongensis]QKR00242.1 MFS transporter [Metallosphaera tengchongensis]